MEFAVVDVSVLHREKCCATTVVALAVILAVTVGTSVGVIVAVIVALGSTVAVATAVGVATSGVALAMIWVVGVGVCSALGFVQASKNIAMPMMILMRSNDIIPL
jgi:predicted exporter